MSNWQEFTVVFYALALAVFGNALVWFVASAFVRLFERSTRRFGSGDGRAQPPRAARTSDAPPVKQVVALGSR